jgi:hypothetical protein
MVTVSEKHERCSIAVIVKLKYAPRKPEKACRNAIHNISVAMRAIGTRLLGQSHFGDKRCMNRTTINAEPPFRLEQNGATSSKLVVKTAKFHGL